MEFATQVTTGAVQDAPFQTESAAGQTHEMPFPANT